MQFVERLPESIDWITLIITGCIVLFALTKYFYPRRFQEFIELPITNKYFLVHGKDDRIQHPFNIILFFIQVLTVSLFIYLFINVYDEAIPAGNPWFFIQICTAYSVFILTKFYIEKIIGSVFSIDSIINRYLYQKLSYRNLLAILVFGGNLIFFYAITPTIHTLFLFSLLLVALNVIALFYSFKTNGNLILSNFFYFILYLCALEISPYFILYKAIV